MKISLSVLAGLLLHLQSMDASVIAGPILNPANGHYYLLLSAQSWTASESEAVSLGGHLATIGNQAENDFVYVTFGAFLGVTRSLWIGLNDAALEGTFRWTSGEPLTFVNWEFRSPNNIGGIEHYVHIEPNNSAWPEPGKWNDLSNRPGDLLGIPLNGVVELCVGLPHQA